MNARSISDLLTRDKAIFELSNGGSIVLKNPQKFVSQTARPVGRKRGFWRK